MEGALDSFRLSHVCLSDVVMCIRHYSIKQAVSAQFLTFSLCLEIQGQCPPYRLRKIVDVLVDRP